MTRPDSPDPFHELLAVSSCGVSFYVLKDGEALYLIDSGFAGAPAALDRALRSRGWQDLPIRGILLTHGHLDHILNAARFAARDGAWIAAPEADLDHYLGRPRYRRGQWAIALLEAAGRHCLGFEPFVPDRAVRDGDRFEIWHGLQAIHLPGQTPGHTGYWCGGLRLLFCGDLFASFGRFSHRPPPCFNADSRGARDSIAKALGLHPVGVLPHHRDRASPGEHLQRLRRLA